MAKTGNPDLQRFLENNKLDSSYNQGFFLHLVTDYLFYKEYLNGYEGSLYHDYNKLNKSIIEKYSVEVPQEVQEEVKIEDGNPETIDLESICEFIDEVSKIDLLDKAKLNEFINSFDIICKKFKGDKKMDVIEMKIAKASAKRWKHEVAKDLDSAIKGSAGSEIAAVRGIVETLGLNEDIFEKLIGTIDENGKANGDGIVYTSDVIPEDISEKIREGITGSDQNKKVLNILSTIHDSWVKNHPDNFLKKDRNKERQFVPLQLLDWDEVENDFVFLKPILESAGIEIDEEALRSEFNISQEEYLIDNKIFSHDDLVRHLMKGSEFYSTLEGLETEHGVNICEILENKIYTETMAKQIESRVSIKSKDEHVQDITNNDSKELDKVLWIETVERDDPYFDEEKLPNLNEPTSRREVMLSKLTGKPYPDYVFDGITDYKHDSYKVDVRNPKSDEEIDRANEYERKLQGTKRGVTPEEIARVDKEQELTTTEVKGIKAIFEKIKNFFKGKGEK